MAMRGDLGVRLMRLPEALLPSGVVMLVCVMSLVMPVSSASAALDDAAATRMWSAVDGRVWAIERIGEVVYVGGDFTGVASTPNASAVAQPWLVAFDARSGEPIGAFDPTINGRVRDLSGSADGRVLFVGGDFTTVNGQTRVRLAALDPVTGANVGGFVANAQGGFVRGLALLGDDLYVGGSFSTISGVDQPVVAKLDSATGIVDETWRPQVAGGQVNDIASSPDGDVVFIGGAFSSVDGQTGASWVTALDSSTGAVDPTWDSSVSREAIQLDATDGFVAMALAGAGGLGVLANEETGTTHRTYRTDGDLQAAAIVGERAYYGGHHYQRFGTLTQNVRRLNAASLATFQEDPSFLPAVRGNPGVWALREAGPYLFLGGTFDRVASTPAEGIARLGPDDASAVPGTPTGVLAVAAAGDAVRLSWNSVPGATGYYLYRSGRRVASTTETTGVVRGLAGGVTYSFEVVAHDDDDNWSWPSRPAFGSAGASDTTAPTQVDVSVATILDTSVSLSWTESTDLAGPPQYDVYRDGSLVATTSDLFFEDTGLAPSTPYSYVVTARDVAGNSTDSDRVGVVTADPITPQELIAFGSNWRYLDDGSEHAGWRGLGFDDSSWSQGPAQLGYGDNDEATVVSFGPDATDKFVTTWFRRTINIPDPGAFDALSLGVVRDDGVVVYVNGQEVARDNMGGSTVLPTTFATSTVGGAGEDNPIAFTVPASVLVTGANVVAVEIHQAGSSSSDISFDLELSGLASPDGDVDEPTTDTSAPSVPSNVVVTATSQSSVSLSWGASSDDTAVAGYRVFRDGVGVASTSSTSFADSGLSASTMYGYAVTAFDAAGNESAVSELVEATTSDVGDTSAPSVPSNVVVTATSQSSVTLSWGASSDDTAVAGYRVFRDGVGVASTSSTSFADSGLSASTMYRYAVTAFDAAGNESAVSDSVDATTDSGPGVIDPELIAVGAVWTYLDSGVAPAADWNTFGFDDSAWLSGPAELGSAEGDEATVMNRVAYNHKVHYLRHSFEVADPTAFAGLELALLVDDGAAVYLNGVEVVRQNLPTGTLTNDTNAITNVWQRALETAYTVYTLPASVLVPGTNLLAVSVHNAVNRTVSDVSFNLSLHGLPSGQ